MPKIEYVPKNFSADRLQMIEKVNGVVAVAENWEEIKERYIYGD